MRQSTALVPNDIRLRCDYLAQDLKSLGVDYLGHGVICPNGHHTGYFSNHEWGEKYFRNGYFFVEPILDALGSGILNFVEWESLRHEVDQCAVSLQRYHLNRLTAGCTIAYEFNGYKEYLNVGFQKDVCLQHFIKSRRMIDDYFCAFRKAHTVKRLPNLGLE